MAAPYPAPTRPRSRSTAGVLADIDARGIHTIMNLGDVIGKGPRGSESVRISRERCAVTVRGNWEDFLPVEDPSALGEAARWWNSELTPDDRKWLRELPLVHDMVLSGRRIRFFHASAESVHVRVHFRHTEEQFAAMFAATDLTGPGPEPTVVGYGDIHVAYPKTSGGRTLFNVGSVGNSLDEPTACYVILEGVPDGVPSDPFGLQFVRVAYDIEAEIAAAAELGMPELDAYTIELRTAVYRGRHAELGLTTGTVDAPT
ncbi:metallophosphoesterase family protein [Phytoactinopolyspora halotolerans]|uniref:Metallophosphoesterase family protein n=1 Tax=Phytoactinopolyspora halotolerans TaxID=1981512 RepID=A0A6L9SKB7_9ACTN|nr:metallophosphoesterase family protein [Phytoactinopolyspora halotolerans]NEE04791.1 metallophosphoesterase family protein [Phytoactinopolyspora halotolerans]